MKELLEKYFNRGDYKIIEDTNETMKLELRQGLSSSKIGTKMIQNNSRFHSYWTKLRIMENKRRRLISPSNFFVINTRFMKDKTLVGKQT